MKVNNIDLTRKKIVQFSKSSPFATYFGSFSHVIFVSIIFIAKTISDERRIVQTHIKRILSVLKMSPMFLTEL